MGARGRKRSDYNSLVQKLNQRTPNKGVTLNLQYGVFDTGASGSEHFTLMAFSLQADGRWFTLQSPLYPKPYGRDSARMVMLDRLDLSRMAPLDSKQRFQYAEEQTREYCQSYNRRHRVTSGPYDWEPLPVMRAVGEQEYERLFAADHAREIENGRRAAKRIEELLDGIRG